MIPVRIAWGRLWARVTSDNALKVSLSEPSAKELTREEQTRRKPFSAYLTTVGGTSALNIDGSVTAVLFRVRAQEGKVISLTDLTLIAYDNYLAFGTVSNFRRFGTAAGSGGLTNGLLCYSEQGNVQLSRFLEPVKIEGDFLNYADGSASQANAYASNVDWARFDFSFRTPVVLVEGSSDSFVIVVRDNLTAMTQFRGIVNGWQEIF